ncbi:hypothetical protein E5D57_001205 [Metarhizium anisopliae]|nr:hypothetical protein E5D57_001205 [Metarhizium anisopliae]
MKLSKVVMVQASEEKRRMAVARWFGVGRLDFDLGFGRLEKEALPMSLLLVSTLVSKLVSRLGQIRGMQSHTIGGSAAGSGGQGPPGPGTWADQTLNLTAGPIN